VAAGAKFCSSCGRPVGEGVRAAERKLVTILFADIVGSTPLAEGRDPERVGRILNRYFDAMREVLDGWGGTVEKYIGDAILAVFGVPAAHEDDAGRAMRAALEMQARLDTLNAALEPEHGVRLAIRIGINTGYVVATMAERVDDRFLAGDDVNVAARLEQSAAPGTIVVAERTAQAGGPGFAFDAPVPLELKGKGAPVLTRRLVGFDMTVATAAVAMPGDGPGSLQAPLIARDRELEALGATLSDAIGAGQARLALVFGPAGIGKSRLTREFLQRSRRDVPELTVLRGRCLAAGRGITYWALAEIVRQACGISLDDAPEIARAKLEAAVEALLGDEPDRQDVAFALATTAGIHVPDNPLDRIRPVAVANEIGRQWPRFVTAQARRGPTVLFVEDLHWADDQLIGTLERVIRRSDGPLVVLATARPEFAEAHPEFGAAREGVTSITLRALGQEDGERLVEELLGWPSVPGSIRTALLERAEGNPFFVEQLVGGLIDTGAVVRDGDAWRLASSAPLVALPDTIHGVLAARIDRLPADEKLALQEAAVVGRTFWDPPLALTIEADHLEPALDGLEAKGLVLVRTTSSVAGQTEYAFKHALLRDVAYVGIPLARRAISHARVGTWLQGLAGARDEGLLELVAFHYRAALLGDGADLAWSDQPDARAELRERAVAVLLDAGAVARQRNATAAAIEIHEAALELAVSDEERARAYEELGDDHGWSYHGDPSVEAWGHSLALRRTMGDSEAIARICLKAARHCAIYWGGFATRPSGETVDAFVDEGISRAREPITRAWLLALSALASAAYVAAGRPDPRPPEARIAAAREATELAAGLDSADVQAIAMRGLAALYLEEDRPAEALEVMDAALGIVDRIEAQRDRVIQTSLSLKVVMDIGGDFERAHTLATEAIVDARELSAHDRMHATYFVMAPLYRMGRWSEIPPLVAEHLAAFDEETVDMNCPFTRGGPPIGALVLERLGRGDEALAAEADIHANDEVPGLVEAWMAERALRTGHPDEARRIAERTVAFGRGLTIEEPPYELPVLVEALAELGDWAALDALLPTARARVANVAWLAPTIDRAEAMRSASEGDLVGARAALERALETFRRLGMRAEIAATLERLAALSDGDEAASGALSAEAARLWSEVLGSGSSTAPLTAADVA
jgi:class 3 adenylate cyclase/tetratricopeptide (TPR) repeat protein